ncbi:MAG: response regulator transcription factor [Parafilimonas sp.]|nr:response regulator transcription factor [Parafilimonas sp.]
MLTAIIVDDEQKCCETLSILLSRYCADVRVLAVCNSAAEALKEIQSQQPQLVFLDVEMPHMNGFEMLEQLPQINFELIFTTSYDQYAIKAIRFSALDYLLKPIDREELIKAVDKAIQKKQRITPLQLEVLLQKLHQPSSSILKIAVPTMEGLQMISVYNIISCESDSNYTIIFQKNNQKLIASRTMKEVEEMLEDHPFLRVHRSYIVNLNEVNKYVRGEGGYLLMSDGSKIEVSRSYKDVLLKRLQPKRY